MAIFHLVYKEICRKDGYSAPAAAAYRSGTNIYDETKGIHHDYTRKRDVLTSEILLPKLASKVGLDREILWNEADQFETETDAVVAREFQIALPKELTLDQRYELAMQFGSELVKIYGFAAEVSLHRSKTIHDIDIKENPRLRFEIDANGRKHNGNWHAHILCSLRKLESVGFTKVITELDLKSGELGHIVFIRKMYANMQNEALEKFGHSVRVNSGRSH